MQQMLNQVLLEESRAGRQFVLIVDEGQNLSDELLESIRILSNCETFSAKMIHIILAGQTGLAQKLVRPELVQLKQRVGSIIQLSPFSRCETWRYAITGFISLVIAKGVSYRRSRRTNPPRQ